MHSLDRYPYEEHWQSQTDLELIPSSDGDVHSLAMCIIEVLTDDLPYAQEVAEGKDIAELVRSRTLPRKHPKIGDRVWDLITRMAMTGDHFSGQKLPDVISELELLAREEEYSERAEAEGAISLTEIAELLDNARHLRDEMSILKKSSEFLVLSQLEKSAEQLNTANIPTIQVMDLFRMVLKRYIIVLENQRDMSVAKSYAAAHQHADAVFLMYDQLDGLMEQLKDSTPMVCDGNGQPVRKWREAWHASRLEQLQVFTELLENLDSMVGGSQDSSALDVETQTCLLFELTKHRTNYPSVPMEVATKACFTLRFSLGRQLPEWFLPQYEVEKSGMNFSKGGFGAVYHGKWIGSEVVVKQCHINDVVAFEREVEIWYKLYHPHVVKFLGACHVGQLLFVSEYAAQGQLDQYLRKGRRHEVWQKLHEAALGLQYLHLREVIHCDLKCNNILVGSDGKAKLTDFGLSSSQQGVGLKPGDTTFGNVRWAAPEVLRGAKPSPESDVYAFGMCIVEAVSGELPYATTGGDKNAVISVHVKEGGFVDRPASFRYDPHWALVLHCCRENPSERINVDDLVQRLEQFAVQAAGGINAVEGAEDAGSRWAFNDKTEGAGNDTSFEISDAEDTSSMSISGASSRGYASYDAASVSKPVSELSTFT